MYSRYFPGSPLFYDPKFPKLSKIKYLMSQLTKMETPSMIFSVMNYGNFILVRHTPAVFPCVLFGLNSRKRPITELTGKPRIFEKLPTKYSKFGSDKSVVPQRYLILQRSI